ncbi:DUF6449 domain-containing protein [Radiobacillus deserti]|uniref:MFS transporter n=1 Tax=Radiobacillus deserti TaxID=2594883 RepID=A0A516KGS3_9BACI|nr:DUF6449 domain-containing protein [Radiobacillus deserti]QDP40592.1 MFS transporter [Radiobacillus deserti]
MSSNPSWINKGILAHNFRSAGWIGILYFISLTFLVPLQMLMQFGDDEQLNYPMYESYFQFTGEIQVFIMFIAPIISSVVLFRYLQVKSSADYIHSLPIKRSVLFNHQFMFGLVILVVPVLLTGLLSEGLYTLLSVEEYIKGSIITWMSITIIINLFVFATCTLVGIFTGISALQIVLTCILFFLPAGIVMLWMFNLDFFLFGYASTYTLSSDVQMLSPFTRMMEIIYSSINWWEFLIYAILAILFYLFSVYFYRKRKVEAANQAIAFIYLRPIFKYGVTICFMLLSGIYFGETQGDIGWLIFGYVVGAIFGYIIAEIVLLKTWRVFHRLLHLVPFTIVMFVIGLFIHLDVFGYESKIPEEENIQKVYFGESLYEYQENQVDYYANEYKDPQSIDIPGKPNMFEERRNIKHILDFHKAIIENQSSLEGLRYGEGIQNVAFVYELENGDKVIREYDIPLEAYKRYYEPIYASMEYKQSRYAILHVDPSDVNRATISSYNGNKQVIIQDSEKLEAFITLLQEEVKNEAYDETFSRIEPWGSIDIMLQNGQFTQVDWRKSYREIEQWLKDEGLLAQAKLTPEDVEKVVIAPYDQVTNGDEDVFNGRVYNMTLEDWKALPNAFEVEEPEQIDMALRNYSNWSNGDYVVVFFLKEEYGSIIGTFTSEQTPDFVNEHY